MLKLAQQGMRNIGRHVASAGALADLGGKSLRNGGRQLLSAGSFAHTIIIPMVGSLEATSLADGLDRAAGSGSASLGDSRLLPGESRRCLRRVAFNASGISARARQVRFKQPLAPILSRQFILKMDPKCWRRVLIRSVQYSGSTCLSARLSLRCGSLGLLPTTRCRTGQLCPNRGFPPCCGECVAVHGAESTVFKGGRHTPVCRDSISPFRQRRWAEGHTCSEPGSARRRMSAARGGAGGRAIRALRVPGGLCCGSGQQDRNVRVRCGERSR